ncbi:fibronectin type III domain-containing protein [Kineococcus terrestris]|uniref:fibronectin type III domain-containing protein n=1 Tax=Kineococcus terrestris TaxID=2044856 RepID=UPI0034DAC33A
MALGADGKLTLVGDVDLPGSTAAAGTLTVTPSATFTAADGKTYPALARDFPLDATDGTFGVKLPPTPPGITYDLQLEVRDTSVVPSRRTTERKHTTLAAEDGDADGIVQWAALQPLQPAAAAPQGFLTRERADTRYLLKGDLPELTGVVRTVNGLAPDAAGNITVVGDGTADLSGLATKTELTSGLSSRALVGHTHTSAQVTDFTEAVQDAVAALISGGTGVTVTYDDANNRLVLTAAVSGGGTTDPEAIRDTIGAALTGVGLVSVTANDALDTITITTTATQNSSDAQLRDRATHTGAQEMGTVTGLIAALADKANVADFVPVTVYTRTEVDGQLQALQAQLTQVNQMLAAKADAEQLGNIIDRVQQLETGAGSTSRAPAAPAALTFTLTDNTANLSWSEPTDTGTAALTGYVYGHDGGASGAPWTSPLVPTTQTTATLANLTAGETYAAFVRAVNGVGPGAAATTNILVPAVGGTRIADVQPFVQTSPWNLPIAQSATFEPVDSPATVALRSKRSGAANQGIWANQTQSSHPVNYAAASDPLVSVTDRNDSTRSKANAFRSPAGSGTLVANEGSTTSDRHSHTVQPPVDGIRRIVAENIGVQRTTDTEWSVSRNHRVDLYGTGLGPQNGVRAYGGSALGGLIRKEDIAAGVIKHPLAIALRATQLGYINNTAGNYGYYSSGSFTSSDVPAGWPAGTNRTGFSVAKGYKWPATEQDYDAPNSYTGAVYMGSYVAIPSSVDPYTLNIGTTESSPGIILFRALQDYGAYVTDRAGDMAFYVEQGGTTAFRDSLIANNADILNKIQAVLRVVQVNDHANPNGGPLGAPRRKPLADRLISLPPKTYTDGFTTTSTTSIPGWTGFDIQGLVDSGGAGLPASTTGAATRWFAPDAQPNSENQYVDVVVGAPGTGTNITPNPGVRCTKSGTSIGDGYFLSYSHSSQVVQLLKRSGGTQTVVATQAQTSPPTRLRLTVTAGRLRAYVNGATTPGIDITDSTPLVGGSVWMGLRWAASGDQNMRARSVAWGDAS